MHNTILSQGVNGRASNSRITTAEKFENSPRDLAQFYLDIDSVYDCHLILFLRNVERFALTFANLPYLRRQTRTILHLRQFSSPSRRA